MTETKSETPNPELYRELSEPFETDHEADLAIKLFRDGVADLRKRCGLPDVYVIASGTVKSQNGQALFLTTHSLGDSSRSMELVAYALGHERRLWNERVEKLMKGSNR